MIYKCGFSHNRICKSLDIDLQVRFYVTTAVVNAFYPKNLKRASSFTLSLSSPLWPSFSLFLCSRLLCIFVPFCHCKFRESLHWHCHFHSLLVFVGIGIFIPYLFSLAHWHFRLLFHWNCSFIFALRWSVVAPPPSSPPPPLSCASATLITSNLGSQKGWCSL